MKRSEIQKDPVLKSKLNPQYYSRPTDRKDVFDASDYEVQSASANLRKQLEQNAQKYERTPVRKDSST